MHVMHFCTLMPDALGLPAKDGCSTWRCHSPLHLRYHQHPHNHKSHNLVIKLIISVLLLKNVLLWGSTFLLCSVLYILLYSAQFSQNFWSLRAMPLQSFPSAIWTGQSGYCLNSCFQFKTFLKFSFTNIQLLWVFCLILLYINISLRNWQEISCKPGALIFKKFGLGKFSHLFCWPY